MLYRKTASSPDRPPIVPDQDVDTLITPNRDLDPVPRPGSVPPEEGEPDTDDKVA